MDREIRRLRLHARKLEQELDQSLDFVQDNYSSLLLRSVLPLAGNKWGVAGSIFQLLSRNQRLQESLSRLADQAFGRIADVVEFLADKLDRDEKPVL